VPNPPSNDPANPAPANPPANPPDDPDTVAARDNAKGLIKEAVLEIIAEREAAPPKGKNIDFLTLLFGKSS
jgi:hypothetical protein